MLSKLDPKIQKESKKEVCRTSARKPSNIEPKSKEICTCEEEEPIKQSSKQKQKSKSRGGSEWRRSRSRDRKNDSCSNRRLSSARGSQQRRSKSRLNTSGIPLYRNNSARKTEEKTKGVNKLIVNLEWPVQWKPDENKSEVLVNHSRGSSMENNFKRLNNDALTNSHSSEQFNLSGLNNSKWYVKDPAQISEERSKESKYDERESETYKSFLNMIKQRNERQNDEIKILY